MFNRNEEGRMYSNTNIKPPNLLPERHSTPTPLYPRDINFPENCADYFAFGKENDATKVKNLPVFAERNALSGKIFNVRENAHNIPQCKKGPAGKERFFAEKGGVFPEK